MSGHPTLLVGTFSTKCSVCNGGCSPSDETHEKCIGYAKPQPDGCGVRFTHIQSTYYFAGADARMAVMRPDLIVVPIEPAIDAHRSAAGACDPTGGRDE